MTPIVIPPGQPFTLHNMVYVYTIADGKLVMTKYTGTITKSIIPDDIFDELWYIHRKGNKKTAKQRYEKVIKKTPHNVLVEKLKEYIQSNDFIYLKGLDVWLNPEKEHWNDPIVNKKSIQVDKPKDLGMQGMVI